MPSYTLSHLEDHDVQKGLLAAVPVERTATAAVLAHIAEFDARQLYRDQACSSMFVYCVRELGYSEDGAQRRLQAARLARRFPLLFDALADGRLHMTALALLEPHLTEQNAVELVSAASHRSKAELVRELAARFPRDGAAELTKSADSQGISPALARVDGADGADGAADESMAGDLGALLAATSPGTVASASHRRDRLTPISADAWALEATLDQESCDMLRRIQALRGRGVSPHDIAGVIKRAFRLLEDDLLMRKLGAGTGRCRGSKNPWHITPVVMRLCWKRDDARCTFVGENGKRCNETHDLQFDHIVPPSRGGDGSLGNVRLRCRAHNLHAAEKLYGRQFVQNKREEAKAKRAAAKAEREAARARVSEQREADRAAREAERERQRGEVEQARAARDADRERQRAAANAARAAATFERDQRKAAAEAERAARASEREQERASADAARAAAAAEREQRRSAAEAAMAAAAEERAQQRAAAEQARAAAAAAKARVDELVPALRSLGCSLEQARQAAAAAEHIPDAPLEARLLAAIRTLGPRGARKVAAPDANAA